jgi:hypothetical protein
MGSGDITVHGFRSSFRNWATEVERVEYATAGLHHHHDGEAARQALGGAYEPKSGFSASG